MAQAQWAIIAYLMTVKALFLVFGRLMDAAPRTYARFIT